MFTVRRRTSIGIAALCAVIAAGFSTPTVASADPETTDVAVHINAQTVSGEDVTPNFDQIFIDVIVDGEGVMYNSTGTDDGENFLFTSVPIYDNAEYVVWANPASSVTSGFVRTGDEEYLADGTNYYPALSSSWVGLTANPETVELDVTTLAAGEGSICGSVVDTENGDSDIAGAVVYAESTAVIDGESYMYRGQAISDESGTYCFDGLLTGQKYWIVWDPWNQNDQTYFDNNYNSAGEYLRLRDSTPNRTLTLYASTYDTSDGDMSGSLTYQLNLIDPNGDPVAGDGMDFMIVGGNFSTNSGASDGTVQFSGLRPGHYTVSVQNQYLSAVAVSTRNVVTVSDADGAVNESDFVVYTIPEGAGGVHGVLDWGVDTDTLTNSEIGLSAISIDTGWTLPETARIETYYAAYPNESGEWSFTGIPDGEYRITFPFQNDEGSGQAWTSVDPITVTIANGEDVDTGTQTPTLIESSGDSLVVKLKNSVTRLPVPGATCSAQIYGDIHTYSTVETDANGIAEFSNLFRGYTYDVRCSAWGAFWGVGGRANAVTIHAGVNNYIMPFDAYEADGHATGRVVDPDGNPLEGVRVGASQGWQYPDCECGDGFMVDDITADDGTFQLDDFVVGRPVTMIFTDRTGTYAETTFVYQTDSNELMDFGDIELRVGADVTGSVEDENGDPAQASIILTEVTQGSRIYGYTDAAGEVHFDNAVPLGDYTMFVSTGWAEIGQPTQGFVTESGSLSLAKSQAAVISVTDPEPALTVLPTATTGDGGTIAGTVSFVDAEGNRLTGSRYDAKAHFYVSVEGDWEEITEVYGWASSELDGDYYLSGIPAGEYKVCFTDYYTSVNRFAMTCNGDSATLDGAPVIELGTGQNIENIDVSIEFRQPDVPPQPISLDELDDAAITALEDQIAIVESTDGVTTIQVDVDLAGQWVAAEVIDPAASAAPRFVSAPLKRPGLSMNQFLAPMAAPVLSDWLQVSADGLVEIPTSSLSGANGGQLAVLSSDNVLVGWTDVAIDSNNNSGGSSSNGSTDTTDTTIDDVLDGSVPVPLAANSGATGGSKSATGNLEDDYGFTTDPWLLPLLGGVLVVIIATGVGVSRARSRARG